MKNYFRKFLRAASLAALAGATFGNLTAREHWHVYDALGNTVVSMNAEAIVASIESTAFGESRSPTAGARFTGKPYDADLGAHVFPFRNYRSDSGRWTSADPSGFPDGVNGQAYAPVPISTIDPLGLSEETYQQGDTYRHIEGTPDTAQTAGLLTMSIVGSGAHLVNDDSGLFEVQFSVGSGVSGGWIVQHITATNITFESPEDTVGVYKYYNYWEQFEVAPSGSGFVNYEGVDQFAYPSTGFAGNWTMVGYAKYISVEVESSGSNPDSWDFGFNQPDTLAGLLRATTNEPSWWSDSDAISHSAYYSYYE